MARVPQFRARDFQLTGTSIGAAPQPVDTGGLRRAGNALINRGIDKAVENAQNEATEAQLAAGPDELVTRDSGFFGFGDREFDERARFIYTRQKQLQIDQAASDLAIEHATDPMAFEQAWLEQRNTLLENVPVETRAGLDLFAQGAGQRTVQALQHDNAAREIERANDMFAIEADNIIRQIALEREQTGEVTPETEGNWIALLQRGEEMGLLPAQIDAIRNARLEEDTVASLVNQFHNSPDRIGFLNSLLENDGPLSEFTFVERLGYASRLRALDRVAQAEQDAIVATLRSQMRDALTVERDGRKHQDTETLLGQAAPFAADLADEIADLSAAVAIRDIVANAVVSPNGTIDRGINELREKEQTDGLTLPESTLLTQLEKLRTERTQAVRDNDLLDHLNERGAVNLTSIDPNGVLADPAARNLQVTAAATAFGTDVSFYTRDEIGTYKQLWENGSIQDRRQMLVTLQSQTPQEHLGPTIRNIAKQTPQLAQIATLMTSADVNDQRLAVEILDGMEFMENNPNIIEGLDSVRETIVTTVGRLLPTDTSGATISSASDMVLAMYANRLRNRNSFSESTSIVREALSDFFGYEGSRPPTINGESVMPFTRGMTNSQVRDTWQSQTDDQLRAMSGGFLPVDNAAGQQREITATEIAQQGWPVFLSNGRYAIAMPRAPLDVLPGQADFFLLLNPATGRAFVWDFNQITTTE